MIIFVFEGKSYDTNEDGLEHDSSLSLHETFAGAEEALDVEKTLLLRDGYIIKNVKLIDERDSYGLEYILVNDLEERKLTVTQWLVSK